jgi:auxin efflux carrier family protein
LSKFSSLFENECDNKIEIFFLFSGLKGLGKQVPIVVGIIVVRFIILPVIGIGIVKGAIHFGLIHPDPLYQFLLLLQFALPPAVALSKLFMKLNNICF